MNFLTSLNRANPRESRNYCARAHVALCVYMCAAALPVKRENPRSNGRKVVICLYTPGDRPVICFLFAERRRLKLQLLLLLQVCVAAATAAPGGIVSLFAGTLIYSSHLLQDYSTSEGPVLPFYTLFPSVFASFFSQSLLFEESLPSIL